MDFASSLILSCQTRSVAPQQNLASPARRRAPTRPISSCGRPCQKVQELGRPIPCYSHIDAVHAVPLDETPHALAGEFVDARHGDPDVASRLRTLEALATKCRAFLSRQVLKHVRCYDGIDRVFDGSYAVRGVLYVVLDKAISNSTGVLSAVKDVHV